MLAFAGNSILCRMALRDGAIDPASFTSIRLLSGAVALLLIVRLTGKEASIRQHGGWISALMLFFYAICFSYAYIGLSAGTGALILFGFVQGTMIAMALWSGDRPNVSEWLGWLVAVGGLVWLLMPGIEAPPAAGATLMALAGIGRGVALAIISGALTSGVGYVIWYAALNYLSAMQAALVQLSVPAIAAAGGVILLAEPVSLRLLTSGILILCGISMALVQKFHRATDS